MAYFCHGSPGILPISERLPCTTSSCDSGSTKFSVLAYIERNVSSSWCHRRWIGSRDRKRQRVVHPAEVPLVAEAEAAGLGRARHAAPRGRLLGDRLDVGERAVHRAVELLEERDRVAIVVRAVLVGHPLAGLARVVAVQHRGDAVDPQAVDVVAVEPRDRRRDQERLHLVAAVVEDVAGPVGVKAAARIGVLEQVRAVEQPEAVRVGRKVRRAPSRRSRRCRGGAARRSSPSDRRARRSAWSPRSSR